MPVKIDYETVDIWRNPQAGFAQKMPHAEGGEILIAVQDPATIEFRGYWGSKRRPKRNSGMMCSPRDTFGTPLGML